MKLRMQSGLSFVMTFIVISMKLPFQKKRCAILLWGPIQRPLDWLGDAEPKVGTIILHFSSTFRNLLPLSKCRSVMPHVAVACVAQK